MKLIVDGHLDLAWNAMSFGRDITLPLDEINLQEASLSDNSGRGRATVSLPEMRRGGVIGVMMDALMLSPTWRKGRSERTEVGLQAVVDHVDHICQLAGSCRHVAIGSDLDGGFGREQCPEGLDTIADLQKLEGLLRSRGYATENVDAIFHDNLLRFLRAHLPETGAELNGEPGDGESVSAGPAVKPVADGAEVFHQK